MRDAETSTPPPPKKKWACVPPFIYIFQHEVVRVDFPLHPEPHHVLLHRVQPLGLGALGVLRLPPPLLGLVL